MFDESFEDLLQRKLDAVPEEYDRREGSVIYNALAPNSLEMLQLYMSLGWVYDQLDPMTADFTHLKRWASPFGLSPRGAEPMRIIGEFDTTIEMGTRFNWQDVNFIVVDTNPKAYELVAETPGIFGIKIGDRLTPIEPIEELRSAIVKEIIDPGRDDETHEAFLARCQTDIHRQSYGGNIADYERMTLSIVGVGSVKVKPTAYGAGTVGLTIVDSEFNAPSGALVSKVKEAIDPIGYTGQGLGLAPIGHKVTVTGASRDTVNIVLHLTYSAGNTWESVQNSVRETIEAYLKEVRQGWKDGRLMVYISQIESRLLKLDAITDIGHTELNGKEENYMVAVDSVPVLGGIKV